MLTSVIIAMALLALAALVLAACGEIRTPENLSFDSVGLVSSYSAFCAEVKSLLGKIVPSCVSRYYRQFSAFSRCFPELVFCQVFYYIYSFASLGWFHDIFITFVLCSCIFILFNILYSYCDSPTLRVNYSAIDYYCYYRKLVCAGLVSSYLSVLVFFAFVRTNVFYICVSILTVISTFVFQLYLPLLLYMFLWRCCVYLHHVDYTATIQYIYDLYTPKYRTQAKRILPRSCRKFHRRAFSTQNSRRYLDMASDSLGMSDVDFMRTLSLVESVYILACQLADASSNKMRLIAIAAFVKGISGCESLTAEIMIKASEAFRSRTECQSFMDYINAGKDTHERFASVRNSPGMTKIYTFLMYVLSLGLFSRAGITMSKAGFSRIEQAALKRKHSDKLGFIDSLVDTTLFLCTAGYQAFQGLSIEHILHSPKNYGDFYDEVEIFSQDYARYEATNAGAGVEHSTLLERLSKLLTKYYEIEKVVRDLDACDRKAILHIRGKLLQFHAKLRNEKICQSSRPAPFSVLIHGPSSVGKSTITSMLFDQFARKRGLSNESEFKYVRSPTQEFWDNFDPKMWCLILDDIAWQNPKMGTIDKSVGELLHIINNVPYVTNQASLEKKGTVPFLAHLVIGTTNTRNLNASTYFSYPAAALRRFPYVIDVRVKEKYSNDKGNLVVPKSEAMVYANYWEFSVKYLSACGNAIVEEEIFKTSEMTSLMLWYNDAIDAFYDNQETTINSMDEIRKSPTCTQCMLPLCACRCLDIQMPMPPDDVYPDRDPLFVEGSANKSGFFSRDKTKITTQNYFMGFSMGAMFFALLEDHFNRWLPAAFWSVVRTAITREFRQRYDNCKMWYSLYVRDPRVTFMKVGERVRDRIVKIPKFFLVVIAILGAGAFVRYMTMGKETQTRVEPMTREREDYFYSPKPNVTSFESNAKSKCVDLQSLCNRVSKNVGFASIHDLRGVSACRLLGIGGSYYITNNHSVPLNPKRIDVRLGEDRNGVSQDISCVLSESDISRMPSKDLAIICLSSLPPRRDLREYFLKKEPSGFCEGRYLDRDKNGVIKVIDMPCIRYKTISSDLDVDLPCAYGKPSEKTLKGMCGMPLVGSCGQSKAILGIHAFGIQSFTTHEAAAALVTINDIDQLLSRFDIPIISDSVPELNGETIERTLGDINSKSVFTYIEDGSVTLHGSFLGFRPTPRSRVTSTPIKDAVEKRMPISFKGGAPVMTGWRPWRIAALDMVAPVTGMSSSIVRDCGNSYLKHVLGKLQPGSLRLLHKYDEFDAVNGVQGVAYLDPMKRSTSAGAPYAQSKKYHTEKTEPQRGLMDPIKLKPEMSRRVQAVRDRYSRGDLYRPVFTAHLKDEVVSAKKMSTGKTRVFCGAPFDWSVVVRELFLSHVRLIQNFKFIFECGVGTVAPSGEWSQLYDHVTRFGTDRIIAGDYKAYDKRMPPVLILEAFRILIELAKESGNFTEEDVRSMWCVAYDTAYPLVDFNGDLVTFWGSNPSGHPLTVIINSIANSLYMRYTFVTSGHNVDDFSDSVSLMTYGDDNIMSVSKDCSGFDHTVIVGELEKIGVVYTMADKESESVPFVNIKDANFLKRGWRWDQAQGVYTAPLEEESIQKMLVLYVASKSVTPGEQITDIIRCAQEEWWHYGEEVFTEKTAMLKEIVAECNLQDYFEAYELLSYDALWARFHDCTRKTESKL